MSLRVAPPPLEARGRSPGALWFRHGGFSCTAETLRRANARRLSGGSSPRSCRRFTSRRPWLQKKHGLGNRSYRSAATGAAPSALSSPCNTLRCSRTHLWKPSYDTIRPCGSCLSRTALRCAQRLATPGSVVVVLQPLHHLSLRLLPPPPRATARSCTNRTPPRPPLRPRTSRNHSVA